MDETTVRKHLDDLRAELARFDDERSVLVNLVRNYETWLRMRGKDIGGRDVTITPLPVTVKVSTPPPMLQVEDGTAEAGPSFRSTVLRVLREAHGEPLHAKEILRRVEAEGASSNAKNKLSVVSLSIRGLSERHPIEKAGPRTWRWAGSDEGK